MKNIAILGGKKLQNVLVVGGGKGGTAILKIFKNSHDFKVVAITDPNENAIGIKLAKEYGITVGKDWRTFINNPIDLIVEVTGEERVYREIHEKCKKDTILIPGSIAFLIAKLLDEKEDLIKKLKDESYKHQLILNSTDEAMVVIDNEGTIIFFNRSAERMTDATMSEAVGSHILEIIPNSQLLRVIQTRRIEANQETELKNGKKLLQLVFQ